MLIFISIISIINFIWMIFCIIFGLRFVLEIKKQEEKELINKIEEAIELTKYETDKLKFQ